MTDEEEKKISELATALGLEGEFKSQFEANTQWVLGNLKARQILAALPAKPKRDIRERQPILDYIQAPDGLGPWFNAGVLTRPLMNELSPCAYTKFAYYLKTHNLPDGIDIPDLHEIVAREAEMLRKTGADLKAVRLLAGRTEDRLIRLGY